MTGLIVVFPNKDNATNIRNLLARGGMDVIGVCSTGAQAMHYADTVDDRDRGLRLSHERYDVYTAA